MSSWAVTMQIGELSQATGVSTRSLRYYEQQGLLRSHRRANGYREFAPSAVEDVVFIQDLYSAGLPSEIIRDIIPYVREQESQGDCSALLVRVREVRDELVRREQRITERRKTLDQYLARNSTPRGIEATASQGPGGESAPLC
jgi:DNA-binding transcriptional MerR regulator